MKATTPSRAIDILDIRRGDVFVVRSPGLLPALIRITEILWSKDNEAIYNHCGIILDSNFTTLEALWTVKESSLWRFSGRDIAVYRPILTIEDTFNDSKPIMPIDRDWAIKEIERMHKGDYYPIHRLLLHLFRPFSKITIGGRFVVCSELVAKYLWFVDARGKQWAGTNPDMLSDEWVHWKNMQRIYSGVFPHRETLPKMTPIFNT